MSAADKMMLLGNIYIAAWVPQEVAVFLAVPCLLLAVVFLFIGRQR